MNRISKSIEKFNNFFDKNNVNGEYSIVVPYKSTREKVVIKHSCGKTIERTPNNIYKHGFTCRSCYKDTSRRKSPQDYETQFINVMGSEYKLLSEYTTNKDNITIEHLVCGRTYTTRADLPLTMGTKCPYCCGNAPWVKDAFYELIEYYQGEYVVLDCYKKSKSRVGIKHITCGTTMYVTPYDFTTRGGYCIGCGMSSGENMVTNILKDMKVKFRYQYPKIINPKNGIKGLTFDFSVLDDEENIVGIIEYDGKQHNNPDSIFYATEGEFIDSVFRDNVKTAYCLDHNIPLLRLDNTNLVETKDKVTSFVYKISTTS